MKEEVTQNAKQLTYMTSKHLNTIKSFCSLLAAVKDKFQRLEEFICTCKYTYCNFWEKLYETVKSCGFLDRLELKLQICHVLAVALGNLVPFHNWCTPNCFQARLHIGSFSPKPTVFSLERFTPFTPRFRKVLSYFHICQDRKSNPSSPYFHYSNIYYKFLIWAKYCTECITWIYLKYNPMKQVLPLWPLFVV